MYHHSQAFSKAIERCHLEVTLGCYAEQLAIEEMSLKEVGDLIQNDFWTELSHSRLQFSGVRARNHATFSKWWS